MTLIIRPEAVEELLSSTQWYNERQPGLGNELIDAAYATVGRIQATPTAFGKYEFYRGANEVRRVGFSRFPYRAIYLVKPDRIAVLAFAAYKRRPLDWLNRWSSSET